MVSSAVKSSRSSTPSSPSVFAMRSVSCAITSADARRFLSRSAGVFIMLRRFSGGTS